MLSIWRLCDGQWAYCSSDMRVSVCQGLYCGRRGVRTDVCVSRASLWQGLFVWKRVEPKSICPPVSGKVLFSVAKTKVKEDLTHVIHQGVLCSWDQNSHQSLRLFFFYWTLRSGDRTPSPDKVHSLNTVFSHFKFELWVNLIYLLCFSLSGSHVWDINHH